MTRPSILRLGLMGGLMLVGAAVPAFAQADPHAGHGQQTPAPTPAAPTAGQELPPFIPRFTDEDRRAAFPDVEGHAVHDNATNYFVLFDQLEWQGGQDVRGLNVDSRAWVGRDRDRLWIRAEGDGGRGGVGEAQAHLLYGRHVYRWWDVVVGVRQDVRPGPARTWAAVGVQGLAPYKFDVEATAYVGASGRTHARLEVEYDLLLTNRLVLQPLVEAEIVGKSDPARGIGAGLSTTDAGLRIRYEIRREVAPYIGVTWTSRWAQTADFAEAGGETTGGPRLVAGLRLWF
jgi:copper resistance protein B